MFQEVVGNLVTHIGSGSPGEVEGSLDILSRLIETDVQKMAPFAVFVKVFSFSFRSTDFFAFATDFLNFVLRLPLTFLSFMYLTLSFNIFFFDLQMIFFAFPTDNTKCSSIWIHYNIKNNF